MDGLDISALLQPVITVVVGVVGTVVSLVLMKVLRKYGIELDAAQQAQIDDALRRAALAVEERAAVSLKGGVRVPSVMKQGEAVELAAKSVPAVPPQELARRLDAVLPTIGLGAAADAAAAGKVPPAGS